MFCCQTSLRKLYLQLRRALPSPLSTMLSLQRPGVFPTGSACPGAPGSTLEAAPSWEWQRDPLPCKCGCLLPPFADAFAAPPSAFVLEVLLPERKARVSLCQGSLHAPIIDGCCHWWVSLQLWGQPGGNYHKYGEEWVVFILIGINRAPNSKTYLWDRREGEALQSGWIYTQCNSEL